MGEASSWLGVAALLVSLASLTLATFAWREVGRRDAAVSPGEPAAESPSAPQAGRPSCRAHVRVALVALGRKHHVVVSNLGPARARQVSVAVRSVGDSGASPLVQVDCDEKLPIVELAPGRELGLLATVSTAMGTEFDARLAWINEDGSRETLVTRLTAP